MPRKRPSDDRPKAVGQRIRLARAQAGVTQAQLAERLGVSYQQVNKYERGQNIPSGLAFLDIAQALKASVGWLLGEDEGERGQASDEATRIQGRLIKSFGMITERHHQLIALRVVQAIAQFPTGGGKCDIGNVDPLAEDRGSEGG